MIKIVVIIVNNDDNNLDTNSDDKHSDNHKAIYILGGVLMVICLRSMSYKKNIFTLFFFCFREIFHNNRLKCK